MFLDVIYRYIVFGLLILLLWNVLPLRTEPYCTRPVEGKQACFILYLNESKSWQQAYDRCTEFRISSQDGRLAVDDTEETHQILTRLLNDSGVNRTWLAGKTEPFYWNWAPPKTGNASEPIPVFYQGCYNSSEMTVATSTIGDCEQECNHTRFFANATDESKRICYCLNDVSRHTAAGCRNGCHDLHTSCGKTPQNTAAVYARELQGKEKFNNWIRHAKPDLTERSCMQYKRSTDKTYGCEPASCDRSAPKLCVTVKKENCNGRCYNGSRSHLYYIREPTYTWSRTCRTPGFVPVAITTTDIQDDVNDLFFRDPGEPYWVSGTNMRWVWITGNHETKKDVFPRFWTLQDERETMNNRCMALQSNGGRSLWDWNICDFPQSFICEFAIVSLPSTAVHVTSTIFNTVADEVSTTPEPSPSGQISARLAIILGVTLSLAIIIVSTFTVIVIFRRWRKNPKSPRGPEEPAVYYNDVTDTAGSVVDPAYQSPNDGTYTELQTHEYAKLEVNKLEKNKNKQYENTEAQYKDNRAENVNKQYENENDQYELTNTQYENIA